MTVILPIYIKKKCNTAFEFFQEVKDKYPIKSDLECIDKVRFIKSIEKKKEPLFCDPDVAMVMLAKGQNVINMRNWLAFDDKEVNITYIYRQTDGCNNK